MNDRKKAIETLKQLRLDYEEFYEEHNNEVSQTHYINPEIVPHVYPNGEEYIEIEL